MLVFEDFTHYHTVLDDLESQQAALDALESSSDDRFGAVYQDFAHSLGFESLLVYIEQQEADIDAGKEEIINILNPVAPDDHFVLDTAARGVLNPQGEIQIGSTIYRYQANGHYVIEADRPDFLARIRRGDSVSETEGAVFIANKSPLMGCCFDNNLVFKAVTYANGTRRLKAYQYINNFFPNISRVTRKVQVKTINEKLRNDHWIKTRAKKISVRGGVEIDAGGCSPNPHYNNIDVEKKNRKEAYWGDKETVPIGEGSWYVSDFFSTTHFAEDEGSEAQTTLAMCACHDATAGFSMPDTASSSANVILDGSAAENEDGFFIEIHRADGHRWWNRFFSGDVGEVHLSNFYNFTDPGGNGTTYIVKLAVWNRCTPWAETTRSITIYGDTTEVTYRVHAKSLGWMKWVWDGQVAGTIEEKRRLEALEVKLANESPGTSICYQAHVKDDGWLDPVCDGDTAGTTGKSKRMEAFRVWLVDQPAGCRVEYRARIKKTLATTAEWLPWVADGADAGTTGKGWRAEALQIRLQGCP